MPEIDKIETILIILIIVLEIVLLFKVITIDFVLGLVLWGLFRLLDNFIAAVHQKYFGGKPFDPLNKR